MKVFICWSGRRSKEVAEKLQEWLNDTIDGINSFYSGNIDKGTWWSDKIREKIKASDAGILCITPENLRSPWLHFEAGAFSADKDQKFFPLLYKTYPGQLESPLSHHQATQLTCEDTLKFCTDIIGLYNSQIKKGKIKKIMLQWNGRKSFEKRWADLDRKLRAIEPLSVQEMIPEFELLFQRKTFYEAIDECSAQAWVDRYVGCYETHKLIEDKQKLIRENAWPHVADLYDELIMQLDIYAMDLKALLVPKEKYELNRNGRLNMPEGIRHTCERNRRRVRDLVLKILTADRGPVIDNARLYPKFISLRDRNDQLVYPAEDMIRRGDCDIKTLGLEIEDIPRLCSSSWDFDRIMFYLIAEQCRSKNIGELLTCVGSELERIKVREDNADPMPLYHAVRAFHRVIANNQSAAVETELDTRKTLERIKAFLAAKSIQSYCSIKEDTDGFRSRRSEHHTYEYDRLFHDMKEILEEIERLLRNHQTEKTPGER